MSVCTRKDGQIFVNWMEGGKQKRKYFGKDLKAMAEAVRFNERITGPVRREQHGVVFAELVNAYLTAKATSMSKSSIDCLLHRMKTLILPEIRDTLAMNLNHTTIDRYISKRSQTVKNTTIHRELSDVFAILRWSVRRRLIPRNPLEGYEMPRRDDETILPLAQAEIEAIINHSPEHLRRAILLSFY
jgi:site-specific recombinase XerD